MSGRSAPFAVLTLLFVLISSGFTAADDLSPGEFSKDIASIFRDRCLSCHAEKAEGGLQLTSEAAWQKGGKSGALMQPGNVESSLIWQRVTAGEDSELKMPPDGSRLSADQLGRLRQWIESGAEWPRGLELETAQSAALEHWAFQPVRKPEVPHVSGPDLAGNEIDAFVLAGLAKPELLGPDGAKLRRMSPEADPLTLLRRVTLDLTGLPPTPDQARAFVTDNTPEAYEHAVDRLLASANYGERWARPWLDLCHFADTDGYLTDQKRPVAWRYRQWLIDALNRDLPFDQFTIQQLAGDLLPDPSPDQLIATGFLRNTLSNREGGADLEEFRVEQIVDRVRIVGTGWLGLTVACARCHDHKYDPLSQKEFFQLYAFFDQADEVNINVPLPGEQAAFDNSYAAYRRRHDELTAPVKAEINALQQRWEARMLEAVANPGTAPTWDRQWEVLGLIWGGHLGEGQLEGCVIVQTPWDQRTQDEKDRLLDYFLARGSLIDETKFAELKLSAIAGELTELLKSVAWPTRAPVMREARFARAVRIHTRGDFRVPGDLVGPAMPVWLRAVGWDKFAQRTTAHQLSRMENRGPVKLVSRLSHSTNGHAFNRLDFAQWLASPQNPLTARVVVNRMWQEFFGRGLVDPVDDFGLRGQLPSHPALLDWLASEFIARGWSMKQMHRLIVTSATYRQSSVNRPELMTIDPQNRLLARQIPLRFSSDQVRDAALSVSGLLDSRIGGPGVFPPQPESVAKEGFSNDWPASEGPDRYRRALYTWQQRLSPFAQNVTFDAPPPNSVCTRRDRSNSPLQALTLLNDPVFFEAAQALSRLLLRETYATDHERLDAMIRRVLSRPAAEAELDSLNLYLNDQRRLLLSDSPAVELLAPQVIEGIDRTEIAAWTGVCSVVMNLHEFVTRD